MREDSVESSRVFLLKASIGMNKKIIFPFNG